jgi:hypothetical protein
MFLDNISIKCIDLSEKPLCILILAENIYRWPILGSRLMSIKNHANNEIGLLRVPIYHVSASSVIQQKSPWMLMVHWTGNYGLPGTRASIGGCGEGIIRHSRPHTSSCVSNITHLQRFKASGPLNIHGCYWMSLEDTSVAGEPKE